MLEFIIICLLIFGFYKLVLFIKDRLEKKRIAKKNAETADQHSKKPR